MNKEFISTKLGGRVFTAAVPVVDNSSPTPSELAFNASLKAFSDENIPLESKEGIQRRERVLNRMTDICREWIQSVCRQKGYPIMSAGGSIGMQGGQLLTSGSYRLGVHEPGADIDTILVAPAVCHRNDFFGSTGIINATNNNNTGEEFRDPNSLAERIRRHPDVTNFVPVEGAAVPLLTFDWEGINIDLLFARLSSNNIINQNFDVDNDAVLDGADSATEKSLNGPRVTNLIAAFAGGTPERYQAFLTVVRCVRKWAKARGLYSNKMGYWGGVNINIGVALTVQLFPNACPASLLRKFFLVFCNWRWPQPVMLTKPHDAGYGLPVWSLAQAGRQVAPMITPAYPAMNSTLAVSRQTLQIMQEEFRRAHETMNQLWNTFQAQPGVSLDWNKLFEPSDFFIAYPRYLSICIVGPTQTDTQAWAGFVESRLRKLVSDILGRSLPLKKIQLWPKKFSACVADPATSLLTVAQRQNSITYFIGFIVDRLRMRGEQLNVEGPLQNFREYELGRFQPLVQGMDIICKDFRVKELPQLCFDGIYKSKQDAMKKRRKMRDNDPARLERKATARLDELKSKMAEIQERKQMKRTRDENTVLDDEEPQEEGKTKVARLEVPDEPPSAVLSAEKKHETVAEEHLLENALDTLRPESENGDDDTGNKRSTTDNVSAEILDGYESDENVVGYSKDDVRQAFQQKIKKKDTGKVNTRCLSVPDDIARALELLGMPIVPDSEVEVIGAVPPVVSSSTTKSPENRIKFSLIDNFDVVELDENGHVIDKGDENFSPSSSWIGRKPGFEFKLGERGLGYYRTGKKVVVPSNMAY